MSKPDVEFLHYYDGSANVEFSKEITEGLEAKPDVQSVNNEEWRRYIHANPVRVNGEF